MRDWDLFYGVYSLLFRHETEELNMRYDLIGQEDHYIKLNAPTYTINGSETYFKSKFFTI